MAAKRIPDFAEKIEHLKGVLGAHLPPNSFSDKTHAAVCGVTKENYSRKKNGTAPFSPNELGCLIAFLKLEPEFNYRDFYLTLDELDAKLREHRKGCYAGSPASELRTLLDQLSEPSRPIQIKTILSRQVGGIGGDASRMDVPVLTVGSKVKLVVPLPGHLPPGHLVVLNYSPLNAGRVALLMPSPYAPETAVLAHDVELPTLDGVDPCFSILLPHGPRPLFAIWSADPPSAYMTIPATAQEEVAEPSDAALTGLLKAVRNEIQKPEGRFVVLKAEYHVN